VLNDPIYRDSARYIQAEIAETDGLSKAADLLERAFDAAKKTSRSPQSR
jgi:UDP:flavonoid glycosyltransferase YjiC (YdhE family)